MVIPVILPVADERIANAGLSCPEKLIKPTKVNRNSSGIGSPNIETNKITYSPG